MDDTATTPTGEILFDEWPIPMEFPVQIAAAEVQKHRYYSVVGSSGCKFYIPHEEDNPADNILCTEFADWDKPGNGFSGRTLTLAMHDGTTEDLKGGWHSNAEGLLQETGIDIRDKHKTFAIVAHRRDAENFYDVLYVDEKPVIGNFTRGEEIASELAKKLGTPLVCFSRSHAGAVIGMVYP